MKDEIKLASGDLLYGFVTLRDVTGDGGEVIVSLRVPEQHHSHVVSKRYPNGKIDTHSTLQLDDERKRAIESELDAYAHSRKLKIN